MQHIVTKYHGPTNVKGSRIKATAPSAGRSLFISRDRALSADESHKIAAQQLATRMWGSQSQSALGHKFNKMIGHQLDGDTWAWFFVGDITSQEFEIL